ncbi:MAG: DUF5696 domain-containing protein [Spirochaetaceae bacterium]|nr:DUF5696 domain-containing protein [Spirochaetaceae bacterium]
MSRYSIIHSGKALQRLGRGIARYALTTILCVLCVLGGFVSCKAERINEKPVSWYQWSEDTKELSLENSALHLRFLPTTAEIILTEKSSGVEWRSNPINAANDSGADFVTKQLLQSQFSLLYGDKTGVGQTLASYQYSIQKTTYDYELVDNGINVYYTVSDAARNYYFPACLPEEEMLAWLEKMPVAERSLVESSFRIADLKNLRKDDNRDLLITYYPDIEHGPVYILRDTIRDFMKESVEKTFHEAGYTMDNYLEDSARYTLPESDKPAFSLTIRYTLDNNALVVTVPFDEIAYRSSYPVTRINLLPFFGAGGKDENGYIFVPDGSGAIINFNNGKQNQIAYVNNMYGWDTGMFRAAVINDNKAPYPVFGLHNDGADNGNGASLMGIIDEGSSYAQVRADVSGRNCSYNSVSAQFTIVHGATMAISNRSDKAVFMYEGGLPPGEKIVVRYYPLSKNNAANQNTGYTGMAKLYRSYLQNKYPELQASPASLQNVPIAVELVGAVNKIQHRLGIPMDLPLKLTTYKESTEMVQKFAELGWKSPQVKLLGWFNKAYDHDVPRTVKLIGPLGNKKDFSQLQKAVDDAGGTFYGEADFLYMHSNTATDGLNLYRDIARYVTRERMEAYPYSYVWFGERKQWGKMFYQARPAYMMQLIDSFNKNAGKLGVQNIAFRTIGSKLGADYNERRPVSREENMNMQAEKLASLKEQGKKLLVAAGFQYSVPYASIITDMAESDQGYGITDYSVPFYQIALHGLVPFTGKAINLAEDYTDNILNSVEGGAGLYFSFMKEDVSILQETRYRQFYANTFDKWINDADVLYKKFADDFSGLYDKTIEAHQFLAPDVTVTLYSDGTEVMVNSSLDSFQYKGRDVAAKSYTVFRGGK